MHRNALTRKGKEMEKRREVLIRAATEWQGNPAQRKGKEVIGHGNEKRTWAMEMHTAARQRKRAEKGIALHGAELRRHSNP